MLSKIKFKYQTIQTILEIFSNSLESGLATSSSASFSASTNVSLLFESTIF
uniref:Candidate secreted effector n=1 Tax=Meloidogyne incognita TaxID=6306 RepID=A0A914L7E1_MELIC